jgi:hypothetical protein
MHHAASATGRLLGDAPSLLPQLRPHQAAVTQSELLYFIEFQ